MEHTATAAGRRTGAEPPSGGDRRGDVLLAAGAGAFACLGVWTEIHFAAGPVPPQGWAYPLTLAAAAALLWRRSRPLAAALGCLLGCAGYHAAGYPGFAPGVLLFVACYALAAYGPDRAGAVSAALLAFCGWLVPALPPQQLPWYSLSLTMPPLGMAASAALGASARRRRTEHEERLRQTAAAAEERTGRRLAEERLRIARELHDVLAHTISVVLVQSGLALDVLDDSPGQARAAMLTVRGAARQAMPELRAALDLLRGTGGDSAGGGADRRPQPGLDQLAELVEQSRRSGLEVELLLDPGPDRELRELPAVVQLTVYRIVQESLTNVLRHASASRATVALRREDTADGALVVEVANDSPVGAAAPGPGDVARPGFGLVGIRERAEALGGSAQAGPLPSGGFRVTVRLPLETP
ncbi:sensor histidine kinase [Streptacidiphilus cavernicola]|uniref:histidine kinase n=1 Tax=Streptacidiphilus cavernicola TaxID=3342716 RepID=A0ABV6VZ50_9ACTN